ncbi:hypothetical protein [Mesorhizobium sp. WSM3859]|uniref:hypothetical protein n=1 Tax=Mesorhizobium sp. WSM3859 TaxID=2029402 RepID=UPI001FE08196|nr:hypothetical protein [Mesorhizobium sp. WSM3859]
MELVERRQLPGLQPLFLRPKYRQRGLQSIGEAGRAVVIAHAIEFVGHCTSLQASKSRKRYGRFRPATIRDNVDGS